MKRFTFRLETLLGLKKRREDDLKRELARVNGRIARGRQRLADIRTGLCEFFSSEKLRREQTLSPQSLRASIAYRYRLQRDIAEAEADIETARREARAVLLSLTEAKKESRTLEILKEKKLNEWRIEYKRDEQETIDDVSQKEYIRKKNRAATPADA